MRNEFINHLVLLAESDHRVVLVVGDLGYGVVEPFAEKFPSRFFNAGVAEQNMVGLAAGLASEGFHVFVYSIANFPIFRCAEQIRNDVCYHKLPVTVVSVGGGLAYGNLGYSHHAVQDYAFMRVMPSMTILAPGDPSETKMCMDFILENSGPSYLRLGKAGELTYNKASSLQGGGALEPLLLNDDASVAIICTGGVLQYVKSMLNDNDLPRIDLFTCPIWGMHFKQELPHKLLNYKRIITVEDHLEDGGFGSWVLEALEPEARKILRIMGLSKEVCGRVGSQSYLNEIGGINVKKLNQVLRI